MKMSKVETLHFIVDGKFLEEHCRRLYWFEDNEKGAFKILKEGLIGITDEHVMKVINGDAVLNGSSICDRKDCTQCKGLKQLSYSEIDDTEFKLEITKRRLWLHENTFKIGQYHIEKKLIRDYFEIYQKTLIENEHLDEEEYEQLLQTVRIFRESIWSVTAHRLPSADYIPEKDSRNYLFTQDMNYFLKNSEAIISQGIDNGRFGQSIIDEILRSVVVVKEPTESKVEKKKVKAEGCTLLVVPDPTNNYKYKKINIAKEQLLNYLQERSRGERAMKFTLNMDLDKEKVLKRYENLTKAMGLVHQKLMESMNLKHSQSGIYPRSMLEFFVNEAVQYFVLKTTFWHEGKTLEKLPDEIKLVLPKNHGYVDVYVDGKLVDEKRDLR